MVDKKVEPGPEATVESNMCGLCHMQVARFAPQVPAMGGLYHRECYETWYFGRYKRRPALLAGVNGNRHIFQVRETTR